MSRQRKLHCWKICQFLSDRCLAPTEFFAILVSTWIDFVGPISAQLGFALGYYSSGVAKIEARYGSGVSGERAEFCYVGYDGVGFTVIL